MTTTTKLVLAYGQKTNEHNFGTTSQLYILGDAEYSNITVWNKAIICKCESCQTWRYEDYYMWIPKWIGAA